MTRDVRTATLRRRLSQSAAVLLALVMFVGCGLAPAQGGQAAPRLKPAAGQTFPDAFGDRNTRVPTTSTSTASALYKDSSGRTFTIVITPSKLLLTDMAAREKPESTRTFGSDVYCFNVMKDPRSCQMQLDGGLLGFSSSVDWDGERLAGILRDFYAQMKD